LLLGQAISNVDDASNVLSLAASGGPAELDRRGEPHPGRRTRDSVSPDGSSAAELMRLPVARRKECVLSSELTLFSAFSAPAFVLMRTRYL
jgi:hypothetical protein